MTKDSYNKNKFYSNKPKEIKVKEITLSSTGREGKIYKGKAKDYPGIVKIIKSFNAKAVNEIFRYRQTNRQILCYFYIRFSWKYTYLFNKFY